MTDLFEKIIDAIIEKYTKIMKKSLSKMAPYEESFEKLKEILTQRIAVYFSPNNRTYQVSPQSLFGNQSEMLQEFKHLNEDLLDYENFVSKFQSY